MVYIEKCLEHAQICFQAIVPADVCISRCSFPLAFAGHAPSITILAPQKMAAVRNSRPQNRKARKQQKKGADRYGGAAHIAFQPCAIFLIAEQKKYYDKKKEQREVRQPALLPISLE